MTNNSRSNVIYLHVCDILSMMYARVLNEENPRVILKNSKLEEISDEMIDELTVRVFNNEEKEYILDNFDIFYVCFGYWHNYSNLPIRFDVVENEGSKEASKISKDTFFKQFQIVKYEEFKRICMNQPSFLKDMFVME